MGTRKLETLSIQERRREGEGVYDMLTNRWRVRAYCEECELEVRVSLMNMFRLNGPTYSLWDKTTPCIRSTCEGAMFYKALAQQGRGWEFLGKVPRIRQRQAGEIGRGKLVDPNAPEAGPWVEKLGPSPPVDPDPVVGVSVDGWTQTRLGRANAMDSAGMERTFGKHPGTTNPPQPTYQGRPRSRR